MRISDWSSDVYSSDLAEKSGESAAVANAIRYHYLPTQQGTSIPATREGQIVALADKLDTLAGIFAIGQKPTASKDPYALRRAALGVLHICLEAELPLDLKDMLHAALSLRSEEHTSELQSLMRISYAVFCLKKKNKEN